MNQDLELISQEHYNQPMYSYKKSLKEYPEICELTEQLYANNKEKLETQLFHRKTRPLQKITPSFEENFKRNVAMYLVNLCKYGTIAVTGDKEWFRLKVTEKWHSPWYAVPAQQFLEDCELVTSREGHSSKKYPTGFATILTPTTTLKMLFKPLPVDDIKKRIDKYDTTDTPHLTINKKPYEKAILTKHISLINSNITPLIPIQYHKYILQSHIYPLHNLSNIPIAGTFLEQAYCDVKCLNDEYFSNIELGFDAELVVKLKETDATQKYRPGRGKLQNRRKMLYAEPYSNVCLTRDFKIGYIPPLRRPKKDSKRKQKIPSPRTGDGRFYQRGGSSYQGTPKELRQTMTLNGKSTVEVDFGGHHIRLLYNLRGSPCPDELYEPIVTELLGTYDESFRDAIKTYFLVSINAMNFSNSKKALRWEEQEAEWTLKLWNKSPEQVIDAIKKVHPDIECFLNKDIGLALMFHDSNIMNNILLRLKKEEIYGVPLHDSVICQASYEDKVEQIMQEEYRKYTGFSAKIKCKR